MLSHIYSVFYKKMASSCDALLPNGQAKIVTFLNPYTIEIAKWQPELYEKFDIIGSDGILPIVLNNLFGANKIPRISFDMTSFARVLFDYLNDGRESVFFLGSTKFNICKFIDVIARNYPNVNIVGFHHGYISGDLEREVVYKILELNPKIVVVGMGAPLQDFFAVSLKKAGFDGTIYTCGGFMHQTTECLNYYPVWINKLHLRAFFRLKKEPYVIKRIIKYYPSFIVGYVRFLLTR